MIPDPVIREVGSVVVFVTVIFTSLLLMVALVVDGATLITARHHAYTDAARAARAAAQQINAGVYATTGRAELNPDAARLAAIAVANPDGDTQTDVKVGSGRVTVRLRRTVQLPMLALLGVAARTVETEATATPTPAVNGPGEVTP